MRGIGIGTRQLDTAAESRADQPATDAPQQGVAVVSERALERTRESSLPEALSDKQVHTHQETRATTQSNTGAPPAGPWPVAGAQSAKVVANQVGSR